MIPTRFDHQLADVDNLASGIMTSLRVLRHANPRDHDRMRRTLRERLQDYVNAVTDIANEGAE